MFGAGACARADRAWRWAGSRNQLRGVCGAYMAWWEHCAGRPRVSAVGHARARLGTPLGGGVLAHMPCVCVFTGSANPQEFLHAEPMRGGPLPGSALPLAEAGPGLARELNPVCASPMHTCKCSTACSAAAINAAGDSTAPGCTAPPLWIPANAVRHVVRPQSTRRATAPLPAALYLSSFRACGSGCWRRPGLGFRTGGPSRRCGGSRARTRL